MRNPSGWLRLIPCILGVLLFRTAFAEPPAVDPRLAGQWEMTVAGSNGPLSINSTITVDGQYTLTTANLPPESGTFMAGNGQWMLRADAGRCDGGTYEFTGEVMLLMRGQAGPALWRRVKGPTLGNPP